MARSLAQLTRNFCADECGTTAIEYALIAAGIGATVAATVYNMGTASKQLWWDKIGASSSVCPPCFLAVSVRSLTSPPTWGERGRRRHCGRCRTCWPCRGCRTCRCGPAHHRSGSGGRSFAWRPGVLVVRRTVLRRFSGAAPPSHPRFAASLRCRTGSAPPASIATRITGRGMGRSLCRFRRGRKTRLAARTGPEIFPIVGWAERGGYLATGHGNSVPRFHVTWGTGPA